MISKDEVMKIAGLAMLELTEEEVLLYSEQLSSLLEHFNQIQSLNLDDIEPTNNALVNFNVLRADIVEPSKSQRTIVSNAPETDGKNFNVPAIIETEE